MTEFALLPMWPAWLAAGIIIAGLALWLILFGGWDDDD